MAILKNGLWGGVTGNLGNTVCYVVKGRQIVRMKVNSTKAPTQRQLYKRAEMRIVHDFLQPIKELVNIGYANEAKYRKTEPYNMAFGYIKKHALKGEGADRQIDYEKVMVSRGDAPNVDDGQLTLTGNVLTVTWSTAYAFPALGYDEVMVLVYFPAVTEGLQAKACYNLYGVRRLAGQQIFELPDALASRPMHVYVFVTAKRRKSLSNSIYLGTLGV